MQKKSSLANLQYFKKNLGAYGKKVTRHIYMFETFKNIILLSIFGMRCQTCFSKNSFLPKNLNLLFESKTFTKNKKIYILFRFHRRFYRVIKLAL